MTFVNARPAPVVDFGEDPNNPARGLIRDAMLRLHGFLVPVIAGGDVDPGNQFFGDGPQMQSFVGAANPASTNVVFRNGDVPTISSGISEGPVSNPAARIFADRLRRRNAL